MSNNIQFSLDMTALLSNGKYIIPSYQRNYAWGKAEISQLIRDIKEFFQASPDKNYYIGSLVCFKRVNDDYELIDGQQRHTTISLINAYLKSTQITNESIPTTNLKFDSRKNAQQFLEEIHSTLNLIDYIDNTSISGVQNFKDAIGFIGEEFQELDITEFANNFYNKVKFFRVEVPQETDLNHYFEIMNSRGEQLEKHEIVKALLMGKIKNEDKKLEKLELEKFAIIWDACSDMSNYIWFNLDSKIRKYIFDSSGNLKFEFCDFSKNLTNIEEKTINSEADIEANGYNDHTHKLFQILNENSLSVDFPFEEKSPTEKYKSVIDFPNFLLQVLKIKKDNISLDDKKLIEEFKKEIDPKEFIFDLLKQRIKFDKYIIKQDLSDANEDKQNWGIRTLNTSFEYVVKTFEGDEEIVKLQTMLYYSNPSKTNNYWVQEILKFDVFQIEDFTKKVFIIAKERFKKSKDLTYPAITVFNLYFIDFLLWKLYKDEVVTINLKSLKEKIHKHNSLFNSFKVKQLNSKEHLFPQASVHYLPKEALNGIGNLCLISTNQNSAGNKENPSDKRKRFENDNSSLKRIIMFESFEDDKWGLNQIQSHENEINALINHYTI